jgi:mannose-6-phosphate isomerase-like protein (cupin superfamily)
MPEKVSVAAPVDRSNAEHYVWGDDCDGWHLLKRDDLSVIAERVPAGAREARHVHARSRQFFFILSGCAVIEVDGRRNELGAGQGLEIAPGQAHQFHNEAAAEVHFLVISQPTTRGDRTDL